MPKAGLFAGEVTQAAPADGASTQKNKGYQWMEYGNLAAYTPVSYEFSATEGWAATQDQYKVAAPHLPHPFRDIDTTTMTLSAVFRPADLGLPGQGFQLLDWGNWTGAGGISASRRPISSQMYFVMSLPQYQTSTTSLAISSTAEISLTKPTWTEEDWYFMGLSYEKDVAASSIIMNLTRNDSFTIGSPKLSPQSPQVNVSFPTTAQQTGTAESIMCWACGSNTIILESVSNAWLGQGSQILVHDKYINFYDYNETSKLCRTDGVIDLGLGAVNVWGEQVLYYAQGGIPLDNEGSVTPGDEPDYWIHGTFVAGASSPPVAT